MLAGAGGRNLCRAGKFLTGGLEKKED